MDWQRSWPHTYEQAAAHLLRAAPRLIVGIEHIGSTAVIGLRSKPVVDIVVGVRQFDDAASCAEACVAVGFTSRPEFGGERRIFLERDEHQSTTVHLHVCEHEGFHWRRYLGLRDALRRDDRLREEYVAVKESLARQFGDDRAAYSDGKSAFIRAVERDVLGLDLESD